MNWIISILVISTGVMLVIKTQWIYDFTGPVGWAEQHLGTEGGTRLLIKLIGITMIIGTFMAVTGLLGSIIRSIFKDMLNL